MARPESHITPLHWGRVPYRSIGMRVGDDGLRPGEVGHGDQMKGKWNLGGFMVGNQYLTEYQENAVRLCV